MGATQENQAHQQLHSASIQGLSVEEKTYSSIDRDALKGKRLVVTSFDLQQKEHRGIAVYSKAILKALKQSGAEIWLLTDFDPPLRDKSIKRSPTSVKKLIYEARVLHSLANGYGGPLSPWSAVRTVAENRWASRALAGWTQLRELADKLKPRHIYKLDQLKHINLHELYDSPYQRIERLDYLENLDGLIGARYLYLNAFRKAIGKTPKPVKIELGSYDALITTAPMNLQSNGVMVQTIHDMIPIEYVETSDHIGIFNQRMLIAKASRKLFVSESSRKKYEKTYGKESDEGGTTIVQPPSLTMPNEAVKQLLNREKLQLFNSHNGGRRTIKAFKYILFNASIEPRKNLLPIIKAYHISGLAKDGIRLCITGQLKKDPYSNEILKLADENIVLTSYVDEIKKTELFLNGLFTLSPSLVEGFGIPVLDAACVGMQVIASPSQSHREIQSLYDFKSYVWLNDTREPLIWAQSMVSIAEVESRRIEEIGLQTEREKRIARYNRISGQISEQFRIRICEQVLR